MSTGTIHGAWLIKAGNFSTGEHCEAREHKEALPYCQYLEHVNSIE